MYVYQRSWDILCFWTIFTPLSYFWEGCLLSSGVGTTGDTQWKQLWGQELWTSGHIRPVKGSAFHALIFRSGRMPLPSPVLRAGTAVCTAILSITWCQILSAPVSRIGAVFSGALTLLPAGSALDHMLSEDDTCVFTCIYSAPAGLAARARPPKFLERTHVWLFMYHYLWLYGKLNSHSREDLRTVSARWADREPFVLPITLEVWKQHL